MSEMERVIRFAKDEGVNVSFGAEDASRTDVDFLKRAFRHAEDLGANRVRYADTPGILSMEKTERVMRELSGSISIPIDFHRHNDFGLATANARENGRPIPIHKPLFGSDIFKHESGIHVVGKHSGKAAVKYLAAESGLRIGDNEAQSIIDEIRKRTDREKGIETQRLFESLLSRRESITAR